MVVSVSLLQLRLFSLCCVNGVLAGIDMERLVLGIVQYAFRMLVVAVAVEWGSRVSATAEVVVTGSWSAKRLLAPLCMWVAQYFWPGRTALLHRHFLPSVLRHLPGSRSILFLSLRYELLQPETVITAIKKQQSYISFLMKNFTLMVTNNINMQRRELHKLITFSHMKVTVSEIVKPFMHHNKIFWQG